MNEDNQYTISKYIHEANSLRDVMIDVQSTLNGIITKVESWEQKSVLKSEIATKKANEKERKEKEIKNKKVKADNDFKTKHLTHIVNNLQQVTNQLLKYHKTK